MTKNKPLSFGVSKVALAVAAILATGPIFAQSLSSGVTGLVTDSGGAPVTGAEVTITHVESGTVSHTTTGADGRYNARGLRVGGPYTITITSPAGTKTEEGVYLELNTVATVNEQFGGTAKPAEELETVEVTGRRGLFSAASKGLGTNVGGRALETAVQGNRSLDDIARLDPRIQVTDQNDGSISVAGQPNRYNNITVDGLSQNDPFGLNANGLPYTGSPISPDTIGEYNISTTDFDTGSDTVGANINAVTKSGTNAFHGSAYYALKDGSSMVGDLGGPKYSGFDKDGTVGATLGGPILEDKLFFFIAYEDEKLKGLKGVGTDALTKGYITQPVIDSVIAAATNIGMQPGSNNSAGVTLEDKRYLAKLDWNIATGQRASFTFQRVDEARPTPYSSYVKDTSIILSSDWYNIASKTDNYSLQLFSDWTGNFSTEAKIGYQKYANTNGATLNQPEVDVIVPGATPVTIYMGEDQFRHENAINSKKLTGTLSGTYVAGSHVVKGGFDYLSNKMGDVFGRVLHGLYTFQDKNNDGSVLDELAAKNYFSFSKTVIPNGVTLSDIAGTWTYSQISPFLQDTWQVNSQLSLIYGVRVDIPHANEAPPLAVNSAGVGYWQARFGYPSNTTLGSSNKVFEPRLAFNYQFDSVPAVQMRGGVGLFQSTPPYVWLTNPYLNNGVVSLKNYSSSNPVTDPFSADPNNQPGLQSAGVNPGVCTAAANCQIDVLDPDFKLPTVWKAALALDVKLPWWGLLGSLEYQYLKNKDAIAYLAPLISAPTGTLPDGRYVYWGTYPNASTTSIGTNALGATANPGPYPELYYRSTLLTNTDKGLSNSLTLSLSKPVDPHGFSGNLSLTYTHATEVNPGKSSQAWSNFNYVTYANPNQIVATTSSYEVPYAVKATLNWDHAFWADNKTTVSLFYNGHRGLPYSWIFGTDVNGDSLSTNDLAYIPLRNDPKVSYGTATQAQIDAFQSFIDNSKYLSRHRGQIATRNSSYQPWSNDLDLGLQQEFPGFWKDHKAVLRLDIYNFLNMIDKNWGHVDTLGFFGTRRLANVTDVVNGHYVYNLGTPAAPSWQNPGIYDTYTNPARVVSRWSALLTLKYEF